MASRPPNALGMAVCGWDFKPTNLEKQVALAAGEKCGARRHCR